VIAAIRDQNLQAPAGRVGAAPTPRDQLFTYTVSAPGRLVTPDPPEASSCEKAHDLLADAGTGVAPHARHRT